MPDFVDARFSGIGRLFILPDAFEISPDNCHLPESIDAMLLAASQIMVEGKGTVCAKAVTGEPYIEFASGIRLGDQPEAETDRRLCRWMWCVMMDYWKQVYAESHYWRPMIYWRTKPELITFNCNMDGFDSSQTQPPELVRRIYMRYLISCKPSLHFLPLMMEE